MAKYHVPKGKKSTHKKFFTDPKAVYEEMHRTGKKAFLTASIHREVGAPTIFRLTNGVKKNNVLEIGSGPNPISLIIGSEHVTLIDIFQQHHDKAQEMWFNLKRIDAEAAPKDVYCITADARNGPPTQLEKVHYDLMMMNELLTHVRPEHRLSFITQWGGKSDSILIVDRHMDDRALMKKFPEYMDGNEIRRYVERIGFKNTHIEIKPINFGEGPSLYFFLVGRK